MTDLVLIAKQPVPGRVKTRLHPPLSLEQAAELAAASIADTVAALDKLPADRRILAWDGDPAATPGGWEVVPQASGDLDERIAAAFEATDGPTVLVGMDTPQLTASDLAPVFGDWPPGVSAWFGPAADGGFWALALAAPDGDLVRGVPMSRDDTGVRQLARLTDAGLGVGTLATLRDVDSFADAEEVAAIAPHGLFAGVLRSFDAVGQGSR